MKILKEVSVFFFLFIFVISCRQSTEGFPKEVPQGSVSGTIYDQLSHFPLPGTTVLVLHSLQRDTTDSSGCFFLDRIPSGNNTLVISKPEYASDTIEVAVPENDTLHVEIALKFNSEYWAPPEDDAAILFFRMSDAIRLDSTLAGKIQYRLNIARTVDSILDTVHAFSSWAFGELLLEVTDSIYQLIDFDRLCFNYPPIDSLLMYFHLQNFYELPSASGQHWIHLDFPHNYNMPILAKSFEEIGGIIRAVPNYTGTLPEGKPFDIELTLDGLLYKFRFYLNPAFFSDVMYHEWEIHVKDNQIIFVDKK